MIPDFPDAKRMLHKLVGSVLKDRFKQNSPTLSGLTKISIYEGDKLGTVYPDGKHDISPINVYQSEFTINQNEIATLTGDDLYSKVDDMAKHLAGQMEQSMIEMMKQATDESGNVIRGNPSDPNVLLNVLEIFSFSFEDDDRDKPIRPTLMASPEDVQRLLETALNTSQEDLEDFKAKEKVILDNKYKEYIADLNSRKIID